MEEVDGEAFLGFSEAELLANVSILSDGQRKGIIKIVNKIESQANDNGQDIYLNLVSLPYIF